MSKKWSRNKVKSHRVNEFPLTSKMRCLCKCHWRTEAMLFTLELFIWALLTATLSELYSTLVQNTWLSRPLSATTSLLETINSRFMILPITISFPKRSQTDVLQKLMTCIIQPLQKFCQGAHLNYHTDPLICKASFGKIKLV